MSQRKQKLHFEIVQGGQVVRTEEIDQDVIKVGKLSSSHLKLDDPNVSRIHAVIERGGDGSYTVIDLGSASGTFVNGEKVTKSAVQSGDELRFGDTTVRVTVVEQAQPAAQQDAAFSAPEATVVSASLREKLAGDQGRTSGASPEPDVPPGHVQLSDGTVVEPYAMAGYYDDAGNYIPGFYDEHGQYHHGYGFHDDQGQWQVLQGYYDPSGQWVSTDPAAQAFAEPEGPSDTEIYTDQFFSGAGGNTLEIAFLWSDHVLSVNSYAKPRNVLIGASEENDFVMENPALPSEAFPFVVFRDGAYYLTITSQMSGLIQNDAQQFTVQELVNGGMATPSSAASGAFELALGPRTSARIDLGPNTFLLHFTNVPAIAGGVSLDLAPIPYFAISTTVHVLFLLLAMTWVDNAKSLELDAFSADDRFVQLLVKPEKEEEEPTPDWLDEGAEEEAAKHKGDEGKAGKEEAEDTNKELAIEGPADNKEIELKKARDTEAAMNAGALAVFGEESMSSLWGSGDSSVGNDALHALGNMTGDGVGEAQGVGGIGLAGAGRGGGGVSERGFGMANVGTAGRGGGGGGGKGYGKNAANMGEKETAVPKLVPGKPVVTGSLDREIIRRVVRQHRREIQYCYETELQKNRNLKGRIVVSFTISANGSVISAVVKETSMNNSTVERCMTQRIRRWVFPEPKGGGIVQVNYPFNFSS